MSLIYFLFLCLLSQAASLSFLSPPPKPPAKVLSETVLDEIFEVRYYEQDFQLNSKNFTHIKPMTFMGLNDLRTLNLTRNFFTRFDLNTFYGLINLEVLDLSFNQISYMDNQTLTGLISLEYLYLRGNRIKYLASAAWFANPSLSELTELDLSN